MIKILRFTPSIYKRGKIPRKPNEIAIMDWAANYFDEDIKIGDKITLPIGERKFIDTGKKE